MSMFSINNSVIIIYDDFPTLTHTIPYAPAGDDISPIIAEQLYRTCSNPCDNRCCFDLGGKGYRIGEARNGIMTTLAVTC